MHVLPGSCFNALTSQGILREDASILSSIWAIWSPLVLR